MQTGDRRDTDLGAVQDCLFSVHEKQHFPEVGHVVFTAGGRTGVSDEFHCDARQDQGFGDGSDDFRVAFPDPAALRQNGAQGGPHHSLDMLAVIFSCDDVRELPVEQAGVFAQHIPQTGGDHLHGRLRQDLRVRKDGSGSLRVISDLDVVDDQRRSGGHKAVHGGCCRQNDIGQSSQPADIFAEIIDST